MRIEEITSGSSLTGLEPSAVATVIAFVPIADGAVRVIYQTPDGTLKERLLGRADEETIAVATTERPWSFDGDGEAFKLTVEAKRIDLAFLFDPMMAVHTKIGARGQKLLAETLIDVPEEQETMEETLVVQATASQTIAELEGEIFILQTLEQQAKGLGASGKDRKWDELSRILQNEPQMRDAGGRMRKIIIFSEHRDTLNYLHEKIAGVLGSHDAIVVIHGAVHRDDRRKAQELFRSDPAGLENRALALAASTLVPQHFSEVADRRIAHIDKTLVAVHERLTKEINFWSDRFEKLTDDKKAGKDVRLPLENVRRTLSDLEARLEHRKKELLSMRHVSSATPVLLSGALVLPAGLLRVLQGEPASCGSAFSADPAARSRIEQLAMHAVRQSEESRGCRVVDASAQKCGWDITSYPPAIEGKQPESRHIEVKGRIKGATTITVTRNEMLYALNQAAKFVLAIVQVDENEQIDGPYYLRNPFDAEAGWGVSSINFEISEFLKKAEINL